MANTPKLDPEITPIAVLAVVLQWKAEAETASSNDTDSDNVSYYEGQVAAFDLLESFLTL